MYNFLELNFIILTTFKRRNGLYFWSFIVATWGIIIYVIGLLLRDFQLSANAYIYETLTVVGWWAMVTGQSLVLYSRLHLVLYNPVWLRAVLIMIIISAIIGYIPTSILTYGANLANPDPFVRPYIIYEKIQVTVFFVQEITISALYIFETVKLLRLTAITGPKTNRALMRHLIAVNAIVAILDIPILVLQYANLYDFQTTYKALAYSVKLKFEFSILNRLANAQRKKGSWGERENVTNWEDLADGVR